MIVVTGDPRLMDPDDWGRLPSCTNLPPQREVFGFTENGSRWIVGWNGSWMVRHAGIIPREVGRPTSKKSETP